MCVDTDFGIEGVDYPEPEDVCVVHGRLADCTCDERDFGCVVCEWAYPYWERHDVPAGPVCNQCFEQAL